MKQPSAVIFDLDGVIIDSRRLMTFAFESAYRQLVSDTAPVPMQEFFRHLGDFFPNILAKMGLPQEMWGIFKEVSSRNMSKIELFPSVRELLCYYSDRGVPMAICTGKDNKRALDILKYFDLDQFFETVVTPEMVAAPKPAPDSIYYALNKMDLTNRDVFYIGDAINDLVCAKAANVKSILALWGVEEDRELLEATADYSAATPMDIPAIVHHALHHHHALVEIDN